MENSYFIKINKKRWRIRSIGVIFFVLIIALLIATAVFQYKDYSNKAIVIKTVEDYNIAAATGKYVKINSNDVYDMNTVIKVTRSRYGIKTSESVSEHIIAVDVSNKLLCISISNDEYDKLAKKESGVYSFHGKLENFKDNEYSFMKSQLIKEGVSASKAEGAIYGAYLKDATPLEEVTAPLIGVAILVFALCVIYIPVVVKNKKAMKSMKVYANGNLDQLFKEVDEEVKEPNVYKNGPVTITRNYIIVDSQQIVFAMPIKELMWTYKKTIQNKVYGFIPAGKNNFINFVFSDGEAYSVSVTRKAKRIDETLNFIAQLNLGTFVGYTNDMNKMFKKNKSEFIYQWKKYVEELREKQEVN
jgi:hypothetical protein